MRIVLLTLGLAACAAMGPETSAPAPADACGATRVAALVGRAWNEVMTDLLERSGAEQFRLIRPGEAVTMDHRRERLNVYLDERERIVRFTCG